MNCNCATLPDAFYLDDAPQDFVSSLTKLDSRGWTLLYQCPSCGGYWVLDKSDEDIDSAACRMTDRDQWPAVISLDVRKALLLQFRGGITDEPCMRLGCEKKRVKGVVYCIDHLYENGGRR